MNQPSIVIQEFLSDESLDKQLIFVGYQNDEENIVELQLDELLENLQDDYLNEPEKVEWILYFRYRSWIVWDSMRTPPLSEVRLQCLQADRCAELLTKLDALRTAVDRRSVEMSSVSQSCSILPIVSKHLDLINAFWYNPDSPNFFLCQRIQSVQFTRMARRVQSQISQYDPQFDSLFYPPEKWHLTLCAFALEDLYQVRECFSLIRDTIENMRKWLPTNPVKLRGIASYRDRMLFVNAIEDMNLRKLIKLIRQTISAVGFVINDERDFIPHVTLMKFNPRQHRQLQIPDEVLDEFAYADFGSLELNELCFCFRGKASDSDGFYPTYGRISLAKDVYETERSSQTTPQPIASTQSASVAVAE